MRVRRRRREAEETPACTARWLGPAARRGPCPRHEREGRAGPHRRQTEHRHVAGEGEEAPARPLGGAVLARTAAAGPPVPSRPQLAVPAVAPAAGRCRGRDRAAARSGTVPEARGLPAAGSPCAPGQPSVPFPSSWARGPVSLPSHPRGNGAGLPGSRPWLVRRQGRQTRQRNFCVPKALRVRESLSAPEFTSLLLSKNNEGSKRLRLVATGHCGAREVQLREGV